MRRFTKESFTNFIKEQDEPTSTRRHRKYSKNIYTFDIEVSNGYIKDGKVIPFDYGKDKKYYQDLEKTSICYLWQFGFNDTVWYGRELAEFVDLLELLNDPDICKIIYIHNLAYEFQFLRNIVKFESVFARTTRKPIYAVLAEHNIEIRCSYMLTRLSLDAWAKNKELSVKKLTGTIDYDVIRTPETKLDQQILDYGENDILVMYYGLREYRAKYKSVERIPLTQTGEVRRPTKAQLVKDVKWTKLCTSLVPANYENFYRLIKVFAGGYTHGNYYYAAEILENVKSFDIASSYPWVMLSRKYPMSTFEKVTDYKKYYDDDHSLILHIIFRNLDAVTYNTYISSSHCDKLRGGLYDNGRVLSADYCELWTTNVDLQIIEQVYTWDSMEVVDAYMAYNDYLHPDFCRKIVEQYLYKTSFKNDPEHIDLYMQGKQFVNSLYGMMVTNNIRDVVTFPDDWKVQNLTPSAVNEELDKLRSSPHKNFLAYQFGVFVTAYARYNIWQAIIALDAYVAYVDTDSVKLYNNDGKWFDDYNKKIKSSYYDIATRLDIDERNLHPKDKKGVEHPIGVFDYEGTYKKFVTLGAKRYCYEDDDGLHITVAGVNKKTGVAALDGKIENFNEHLEFDYFQSGKKIVNYNDNQSPVTWNKGAYDEYASSDKFGITLQPTTYGMNSAADYLETILANDCPHCSILQRRADG